MFVVNAGLTFWVASLVRNGLMILVSLFVQCLFAQGTFRNLNFEAAITPFNATDLYHAPVAKALPYWSAYPLDGAAQVIFDTINLDAAGVSLHDSAGYSPPIQGNSSLGLQGPSIYVPSNGPILFAQSAYIAQSGTIPIGSKSIRLLWMPGSIMEVSFNGQIIPMTALGSLGSYDWMGGDISMLAGQYGELKFETKRQMGAFFDSIQFSDQSIPEPSVGLLFILAALSLFVGKAKCRAT